MDDPELRALIRQVVREEVAPPESFLRLWEVEKMCGFKRSTIYKQINKNQFPEPIRMAGDRRVAVWVRTEIEQWIIDQITAYRTPRRRSPYCP